MNPGSGRFKIYIIVSVIITSSTIFAGSLSQEQAYAEVVNILNQAKQAIVNNPNVHLNDLNF